jgi:NADPH:quinone reductase-like Zn-dependent oxidoreductase
VYSFTGASIPAGAKTVSVQYFPNKAQLVEPILSPTFTHKLRDIFTTQTTLQMVEANGDLALEGEIVSYKTTPVAIQTDQTAAMNRLTVVVNVRFVNKLEPEKDFDQKFSQFIEYPSETPLSSVSSELIAAINEMLATDIFNKAVVNW